MQFVQIGNQRYSVGRPSAHLRRGTTVLVEGRWAVEVQRSVRSGDLLYYRTQRGLVPWNVVLPLTPVGMPTQDCCGGGGFNQY